MRPKKSTLEELYVQNKLSSAEIARVLKCSEHKINYWVAKYHIQKRSISEAIYTKHNPKGDPFRFNEPKTIKDAVLFGLGLGLYWGEGSKSNKYAIRLGNTDPKLIKKFINFLMRIYSIDYEKLKFGLQIFSDMPSRQALQFWLKALGAKRSQFQKVIVTPARGIGTYRHKTKHGVLTVHYNNKKIRDVICRVIENME